MTGITTGFSQVIPPIEFRIGVGGATSNLFSDSNLNGTYYSNDFLSAEAGVDVWVTRAISVGFHAAYGNIGDGYYYNPSFTGYYDGTIDYIVMHYLARARISTQTQRFLSVYASAGYQFTTIYYETWDFGRKTHGPSVGGGLNMKFGRFRFNLFDIGATLLNRHEFSDAVGSNTILLHLKTGFVMRIIDPL